MTSVGSIADLVQLPDAEIGTDNAASSPTTTSSGQRPPLQQTTYLTVIFLWNQIASVGPDRRRPSQYGAASIKDRARPAASWTLLRRNTLMITCFCLFRHQETCTKLV
jgi:hypothetical protein